ncbi:UNVERIFIED_ORG: hypothetical protein J2W19_003142 [Shinella zoogloeoides]|nr:hypothetical protein [Shinella zoogloeoides]
MAHKIFTASVAAFRDKTKAQMRDVFAEAVQDVLETAQREKSKGGRMPNRVTGNLINSLASGLNGSFGPPSEDSYLVTLSQMEIGDIARFAWTAPYARRMELGFFGADSLGRTYEQPGNHFVGAAAAQFPQFVAEWAARGK